MDSLSNAQMADMLELLAKALRDPNSGVVGESATIDKSGKRTRFEFAVVVQAGANVTIPGQYFQFEPAGMPPRGVLPASALQGLSTYQHDLLRDAGTKALRKLSEGKPKK